MLSLSTPHVRSKLRLIQPRLLYSRISTNYSSNSSRTHDCGQLRASDEHLSVVLAGWILPQRKISNAISFFPIRDANGTTQLVVNRDSPQSSEILDKLAATPAESVVRIRGTVRKRPLNAQRRTSPTGEIEVLIDDFTLLNAADHSLMPFMASDAQNVANEELRARFRHLDLRRDTLTENLRKRSRVAHAMRNFLHDEGFVEVETPVLLKSTPEGAREFLVPTRVLQSSTQPQSQALLPSSSVLETLNIVSSSNKESKEEIARARELPQLYSLAQSPQQPKQLLICSGAVDRYFQLARCFRDEDGRKDRQPEFTQVDMEMAFVSWDPSGKSERNGWRIGGEEVREVVEGLIRRVWVAAKGPEAAKALPEACFPVMTYTEAMSQFGSDKPDTRFGLQLILRLPRTGELFMSRERQILNLASASASMPRLLDALHASNPAVPEETVECMVVRANDAEFYKPAQRCCSEPERHRLEGVESFRITEGNRLEWIKKSAFLKPVANLFEGIHVKSLNEDIGLNVGDIVFLSKRKAKAEGGATALGRTRLRIAQLGEDLGTYKPSSMPHLLWVTEFPLFTRADSDKEFLAHGRWSSSHHPFTAPMREDVEKLYDGDIANVRGQHYDLVLNGVEIGGGSVRVHDADMQEHIFSNILQLDKTEKTSFNHLLHALRCGAPPHGGIAIGFDRLMAMLCGTQTIRDVIAFPKTASGTDTFFRSPSAVSNEVLAQYGLRSL